MVEPEVTKLPNDSVHEAAAQYAKQHLYQRFDYDTVPVLAADSFIAGATWAWQNPQTEQSEGALWWREALDELASSYEIQAVAAAANGNDETAEHYSNTAYGVRKAFEKLNLVEQRQPTEQAFREYSRDYDQESEVCRHCSEHPLAHKRVCRK